MLTWFLEAVLNKEVHVVTLIKDLALDVWIEFPQSTNFSVLLCHELLVQRCDLDVQVVLRKEKVGSELLRRYALTIPLDVERARFVLPFDLVEVQQFGELSFGVMRELDLLAGESSVEM
jgi:hypothetical protein